MFDVSWSEVLVVLLVGIFVVKPEDIPNVIDFAKNAIRKFGMIKKDAKDTYREIENEIRDEYTYIKNDVGEEFKSYDISELIELDSSKRKEKEEKND